MISRCRARVVDELSQTAHRMTERSIAGNVRIDGKRLRVRRHLNPLSSGNTALELPSNYADMFEDASKPLWLDIGCGRGDYLRDLARRHLNCNILGIEIRPQMSQHASLQLELGANSDVRGRVKYMHFNFLVHGEALLKFLPADRLQKVFILFPDPMFKKRHEKRRVLQPSHVDLFVQHLLPTTEVYISSDVPEAFEYFDSLFLDRPVDFRRLDASSAWPSTGIKTEHELAFEKADKSIFHTGFVKL